MRILLILLLCVSCVTQDKRTYVTRHQYERANQHCYPHVSGDIFRLSADHVVDDTRRPFDPRLVKKGDVIFLKTKYMKKFLKYMHPKIRAPYILVTGNGDEDAPGKYRKFLDNKKLIRWFAMNATITHPKLVAIPIGAGSMWPGNKEKWIHDLMHNPPEKRHLLYVNFRPDNHPERACALAYFENRDFCFIDAPCQADLFLQRMASSKYTVCPRGNGLDTHRVWEALLVGSIPVLKSNELDHLYKDLPVLIVKEWDEVTPQLLEERYEKILSGSYKMEKLTGAYWLQLVMPERFDERRMEANSYVDSDNKRLSMLLNIQA